MEHTVYIDEWLCQTERERERERERQRERERERDESCYVSPRQERFLIHVRKAYFQEIWRGDSLVLVSVFSGKPFGINNELLHLTKKELHFLLAFCCQCRKENHEMCKRLCYWVSILFLRPHT